MKLIIDTNRIIAALIKNSLSRMIILLSDIELISPEFSLEEIKKYEKEILSKSGIEKEEFHTLFTLLLDRITIIQKSEYIGLIKEASKIIGNIDDKDIPFIALALSIDNDGIWSDDKDFERQSKIKIWKTVEIFDLLESKKSEEDQY